MSAEEAGRADGAPANVAPFPTRANNWFAVARTTFEHPIVGAGQPVRPADPTRGAYAKMEAWVDLTGLARHSLCRVSNKGTVIILQRGQLMASRSFLAKRWNWTEKTVRVFLHRLERDGMIKRATGQERGQQKANQSTVITISNYDKFQFPPRTSGPPKGPTRGQHEASKGPESNTSTRTQGDSPQPPANGGQAEMIGPREAETEARSPNSPKRRQFRRLRGVDAVSEALVGEHGFEAERVSALLPLLSMGPRLDDATAWSRVLPGMLKDVPTELLHWTVEDIIQREQWRPSHAAILKGIEGRIRHERIIQEWRRDLDVIRADWAAAKAENPQLDESIGKPTQNRTGTGTPPLDDPCFCNWLQSTGRLQRWKDAERCLETCNRTYRPTWSEERQKSVNT
jgi:hypothetical protein